MTPHSRAASSAASGHLARSAPAVRQQLEHRPAAWPAWRAGLTYKAWLMNDGVVAADRFAALADPTRRHLLEQLATSDRAVTELMAGLAMSQPAVSQHLRVLRDAGLVTARKDGRHRYYQ